MNDAAVRIRELAGWGLDADEYRSNTFDLGKVAAARGFVAQRIPFETSNALLGEETAMLRGSLRMHAPRADLLAEMNGLEWSLGVVDLRRLLAFQRRLTFQASVPSISVPPTQDWPALTAIAFRTAKAAEYELVHHPATDTLILRSSNPNLHLRISSHISSPIVVHTGSPFFEVAQYRARWFLRDGYHRAYALLRAGIFRMPAVIVQAKTLRELGAAKPWFFTEETLFSSAPPRVIDFLDDALTIEYDRPPLIKTLRVTMEEEISPATLSGETI